MNQNGQVAVPVDHEFDEFANVGIIWRHKARLWFGNIIHDQAQMSRGLYGRRSLDHCLIVHERDEIAHT